MIRIVNKKKSELNINEMFKPLFDTANNSGDEDRYKTNIEAFTTEKYKYKIIDKDTGEKKPFAFYKHLHEWLTYLDRPFHMHETPRGTLKSTYFTHIVPMWLIYKDPDVTILLVQKSVTVATDSTRAIRDAIKANPQLGITIGTPDGESQFNVKQRTMQRKESTLRAAGLDTPITGYHPQYIIIDDPLDDENTLIDTRRQRINTWLAKTATPCALQSSHMFMIGTPKHFDDIYAQTLVNPRWSCCIEKAIIKYPSKGYDYIYDDDKKVIGVNVLSDDYIIFAPDYWTIEYLLLTKLGIGDTAFEEEYQCEPISSKDAFIKTKKIKYYNWVQDGNQHSPKGVIECDGIGNVKCSDMTFFMGVDVAMAQKKSSAWFAYVVIGLDRLNNIYVLEVKALKIGANEQFELIITKQREWGCAYICIDPIGVGKGLVQQLSNVMLPIKEGHHENQPKEFYYKILGTFFDKEKVFLDINFAKQDDTGVSFVKELSTLPKSTFKDRSDALVYAIEVAPTYSPSLSLISFEVRDRTRYERQIPIRDHSIDRDRTYGRYS